MNKYAVTNPATGVRGTSFPLATDDEVTDAIGAADRAHRAFSRGTSVAERAALMQRVADLHAERRAA
jgi:succinate-semialdehyde dehydrogenase/glutarate-semialdehyde dehydrogenase